MPGRLYVASPSNRPNDVGFDGAAVQKLPALEYVASKILTSACSNAACPASVPGPPAPGEMPPGSRGVCVYRSDTDPQEYWIAGRWDSKDAYTANSNAPGTDATYRRLRALMDGDPEWHDGEIVFAQP
jgi:hypothetical protein